MFCIEAIYIQQCRKVATFSHSLPTLTIFCLSDNSHPNRCEGVSHCSFVLHLPDD